MQLLPKDEKFYDLFLDQASIVRDAAVALAERGSTSHDDVAALEKKGDAALRETFDRLNRTFITPIDPEDVGTLAVGLEEILDHFEAISFRLCAYHVDQIPDAAGGAISKLRDAATGIHQLFQILHDKEMKGKDELRGQCEQIRKLAEDAIAQVRDAVVALYDSEKDFVRGMKLREVFDRVETAARHIRRFTETVQNIVAKNM